MRFAAVLKVLPEGGNVRADNDRLEISGANAVTILFSNATSFRNYQDTSGDALQTAQGYLHRAEKRSYPELRQRHLKDFRDLFSRVHLNLGEDHATDTTDRRIKNFAQNEDPSLLALYFEFGRYLLISSSRPGGLPANLQGIWNQDLSAAWSSKFTTNINLEMNYWQADTGDLWETQEPLWNLIRTLCVSGARTAQTKYHSSGWVLHHNTDIWAATAPVNDDLVKVVLPYIDSRYRTFPDREHRAIAGPSMGGLQTLNIALDHSADFAYVGVFSSGWFPDSMKEEQDTDVAEYRASGKPFRLFWLDVGKYDIALQNSRATVTVLKDAGIHVEDHESGGFHAWPNWRDYLDQYASLIFKSAPRASEAVGQVDMRHDQL